MIKQIISREEAKAQGSIDMQDNLPSDSQARRAAKRVGLVARKSRWRRDSIDNFGGYMLIDPYTNFVVAGSRFDLDAADVVAFCTE